MGADSKIEWCDATFNPWLGCTKISPACDHCYAEGWAKRTGSPQLWQGKRRRTSAAYWRQPLKWNLEAEAAGVRKRVFCASLADVFDNQVPEDWRADLWTLMGNTPHLDWLLLTKRPQNIAKMLPVTNSKLPGYRPWNRRYPEGWPNVWLGCTVENQIESNRRIPHLLAVPAAVRFLSCEPLLGPLDLSRWLFTGELPTEVGDSKGGYLFPPATPQRIVSALTGLPNIDWVICGGESGHGARPMHPAWARSLRDQCQAAGVAFHFKQWGSWAPDGVNFVSHETTGCAPGTIDPLQSSRGEYAVAWRRQSMPRGSISEGDQLHRVGKKRSGRLLDGREWNEMPEVRT